MATEPVKPGPNGPELPPGQGAGPQWLKLEG